MPSFLDPFRRPAAPPVLPQPRSLVLHPGLRFDPVGCTGGCADCMVLSSGTVSERAALLALLEPYRDVLRDPLGAGVLVEGVRTVAETVPVRVQHLYVMTLRDPVVDVRVVREALSLPGLSRFDVALLVSWCLASEVGAQDGDLSRPGRMTLAHLRRPYAYLVPPWRRDVVVQLLHVYADSSVWHPAALHLPLDFSDLDVERDDVLLAAFAGALLLTCGGGDARPVLAALEVESPLVVELFAALARDAVDGVAAALGIPLERTAADVLELARLTVPA